MSRSRSSDVRVRAGLVRRGRLPLAVAATSLLLASVTGVAAQSPDASGAPAGPTIQVVATEYHFGDLPVSVPAGTSLALTNAGAELHELVLARIGDDVTATLDELLAMEDPIGDGLVTPVGQVFAAPGTAAELTLPLPDEGRYVAICFVPQGLSDPALIETLLTADESTAPPPELEALAGNPGHFALGMIQEFAVTAPDSTPGPLPEPMAPASSPAA